jgi:uncharacterized protein (TIGR04255 family)
MAIEPLFPFAGDNAIQSAVFAIEWTEPLSGSELRAIRALDEDQEFKRTFPSAIEPRMVMINLNVDQGAQQVKSEQNQLAGVNFMRPSPTNPGSMSKAINISPMNCLAIVNEYTRWVNVWAEVRGWLLKVAPIVTPSHSVNVIGMQYTDIFLWKADPSTLLLSEVLSAQSTYLPSHVFQTSSLWHSHHGFFEKQQTEPIAHDLLENINVNMLDSSGQRSLQIVSSHRATLTNPIWDIGHLATALDQLMPHLHNRNKRVLRNLLTPAVQAKIKLQP